MTATNSRTGDAGVARGHRHANLRAVEACRHRTIPLATGSPPGSMSSIGKRRSRPRICPMVRPEASRCGRCQGIRHCPASSAPLVLGPSAAIVRAPNQELVLVVAHAKEWPDTRACGSCSQSARRRSTDPPCEENFEDDGAPKWDEDERILTLFVAKGRIARLRYSSFVHKALIDTLGLPTGSIRMARAFVRDMAQLGCAWMITPYRALTLVHATQQPVCLPELDQTRQPAAQLGDQHANLRAASACTARAAASSKSRPIGRSGSTIWRSRRPSSSNRTGAARRDSAAPRTTPTCSALGPARQCAGADAETGSQKRARGDRHEFGDTKFRLIQYTVRATTRFREYLPAGAVCAARRGDPRRPGCRGPKMTGRRR